MWSQIALICLMTFLSDLVPGPNFWKIVHYSVTQNHKTSLIFAMGLVSGSLLHIMMALVGISALIAKADAALLTIQILGGAYIMYYGVRLIFKKPASHVEEEQDGNLSPAPPAVSRSRLWLDGLLTNLANPKTILFYVGLFAATVTPRPAGGFLTVLVLTILITTFSTNALVACVFSRKAIRKLFNRWERVLSRIIGGMLILGGLKIVLQRRG